MVWAQEDEIHLTLITSSHYVLSDSVSILGLKDESINQEIKLLCYPSFNVLKTEVSKMDSLNRINSVVLLVRIKEGGDAKIYDVGFLGEGNNEIKNSLIQNTSLTVITKEYKLLTDSLPISIKLRIRDMNY